MLFNEPFSPTFSITHSTPPYYDLTEASEHSGLDNPDPTSLNLKDFQATTDLERTLYVPANQPIPEPSEPELTLPTFDEALAKLSEKAEREAAEKAFKEVAEKEVVEFSAKEKAEKEAEVTRVEEADQKVEYEKATKVALTQGESSTIDLTPLVIITMKSCKRNNNWSEPDSTNKIRSTTTFKTC